MKNIKEFSKTAPTAKLAAFIGDAVPRIKAENDHHYMLQAMTRAVALALLSEAANAAGEMSSYEWSEAWDKEQTRQEKLL